MLDKFLYQAIILTFWTSPVSPIVFILRSMAAISDYFVVSCTRVFFSSEFLEDRDFVFTWSWRLSFLHGYQLTVGLGKH